MTIKIKEYRKQTWGKAFGRISNAFISYSPNWVEWTSGEDYDLRLVHVVGGEELPLLKYDLDKTIIIQHCYYTTYMNGWESYWKDSLLTVSFHDLRSYTDVEFPFYRMPWGADPEVFYYNGEEKYLDIFVTGHVAATESIDDIYKACKTLGKVMVHTGENFHYDPKYYKYMNYMSDFAFRKLLSNVKWVAGLRKIEGFEMACVEGMFCQSRPIVYDLPTYDFYKGFAEFVDPNKDVVEQLVEIMKSPVKEFTEDEYKSIIETFSWENLMARFYTELKNYL